RTHARCSGSRGLRTTGMSTERCVSAAQPARTGPASPRRPVCAPGALASLPYRRPSVRRSPLRAWRTQTMFRTTLRWLKRGSGSRRPRPARRPSFVPRLLVLEDRTLPSTLTVLTNADSGLGSLREAIADAQNGDQIVFDPSLHGQTITLTSGQLAVS